jgi:surfeit locus 1 family protein
MIFKKMFSRAWLITTLLVFLGSAICVRLGIWQLDRLKQRRAFNAQVETMRAAELLELNQNVPADISAMEWRAVMVTGEYDFENQVALRNQYNGDQYGYHLITPLIFGATSTDSGQVAVLVDRGFIPADGNTTPTDWRKYDEAG